MGLFCTSPICQYYGIIRYKHAVYYVLTCACMCSFVPRLMSNSRLFRHIESPDFLPTGPVLSQSRLMAVFHVSRLPHSMQRSVVAFRMECKPHGMHHSTTPVPAGPWVPLHHARPAWEMSCTTPIRIRPPAASRTADTSRRSTA